MENLNQHFHISRLIVKSFQKELSQQEQNELDCWLTNPTNQDLYDSLYYRHVQNPTKSADRHEINLENNWQKLESHITFKKRPSIQRWMKYAAILALPVMLALVLLTQQQTSVPSTTSSVTAELPQPGESKAILLLTNGQQVDLTLQQELCHPNDSTIILNNKNNTLTIKQSDANDIIQPDYQTIFIPIGGEYKLILADGTKVWLNSDSRLKFPSTFVEDKRIVHLEGEAYFEVAPNKEKPFIVKTQDINIEVLGTKFNVKAYASDTEVYTTLAEGSVKTTVTTSSESQILEPNEQIQYTKASGDIIKKEIDAQTFISWTKGVFVFENETLEEIMKQLGRWYGTQTIYQSPELKKYRFTGYVNRFDNISTILRMIEKTYKITFNIQGNSITVNK